MSAEITVSPPVPVVQQPAGGWITARLATWGAALCALMSSNLLVTMGIPYDVPYGPFIAKLHPGTYLIAFAFLRLLMRQNPFRALAEMFQRARAATTFAVLATVMVLYSVAMFGPSGSAFIIDTLFTPAALALVLDQTSPHTRQRLFIILAVILAVNAVLGFGEVMLHARLIPYMRGDKPLIEDYFRATALQGHPLSNALRTLVMMLACLVFVGRSKAALLVWLFLAAQLPFGSRTGLVTGSALLALWAAIRLRGDLKIHGFQPRTHLLIGFVSVLGVATLIGLALFTNIGERVMSLFYFDESAKARLIVLRVFGMLSASDLWLGMGPKKIETVLFLLSRTSTVTDIENVWLLFVMQFGLLLTLLFGLALAMMLWSFARRQPLEIKLAVVAFLIFILSNNSLASKSQDMVLFVATVMGASAWGPVHTRIRRAELYMELRNSFARARTRSIADNAHGVPA